MDGAYTAAYVCKTLGYETSTVISTTGPSNEIQCWKADSLGATYFILIASSGTLPILTKLECARQYNPPIVKPMPPNYPT
jgi:hypothetical protein